MELICFDFSGSG